jgi:hypothetical protein
MPGFSALGSPNKLLREDWQHASVLLLGAGWLSLVLSLLLRAPAAATVSALVWSAGVGVVIANHLRLITLGRAPRTAPPAVLGIS